MRIPYCTTRGWYSECTMSVFFSDLLNISKRQECVTHTGIKIKISFLYSFSRDCGVSPVFGLILLGQFDTHKHNTHTDTHTFCPIGTVLSCITQYAWTVLYCTSFFYQLILSTFLFMTLIRFISHCNYIWFKFCLNEKVWRHVLFYPLILEQQ